MNVILQLVDQYCEGEVRVSLLCVSKYFYDYFIERTRFVKLSPKIADTQLDMLAHFEYVRNINLRNCINISNDGLSTISKCCPNIDYVDLSLCIEISDGIKYLGENCPNLTYLDLTYCQKINDDSIQNLAEKCIMLEHINLSDFKMITDVAITCLSENCSFLRYINLFCCVHITDISLVSLAKNCPGLEKVHLECCFEISDEGVMMLAENCNLLSVNLNMCRKITDRAIGAIVQNRGKQMTEFLLSDIGITDWSILSISKNCPNIATLQLDGSKQITEKGFEKLYKCTNLTSLDICDTNISDTSLIKLSENCLKIRSLDISACQNITTQGIQSLFKHSKKLTNLNIPSKSTFPEDIHFPPHIRIIFDD